MKKTAAETAAILKAKGVELFGWPAEMADGFEIGVLTIISEGVYQGSGRWDQYTPSVTYVVDDVVSSGGQLYIATAETVGVAPPDPPWELVVGTGGVPFEPRTDDPVDPSDGQGWVRTDIEDPADIPPNTVLNGAVDPVVGDGVDGDFWINTTTWFIFGPKATTWPAGVSLVGPGGEGGGGMGTPKFAYGSGSLTASFVEIALTASNDDDTSVPVPDECALGALDLTFSDVVTAQSATLYLAQDVGGVVGVYGPVEVDLEPGLTAGTYIASADLNNLPFKRSEAGVADTLYLVIKMDAGTADVVARLRFSVIAAV